MNAREHPQPAVLERFLIGEATLADKCAVVRHLLGGCRQCAAALRPAWDLADRPLRSMDSLGR